MPHPTANATPDTDAINARKALLMPPANAPAFSLMPLRTIPQAGLTRSTSPSSEAQWTFLTLNIPSMDSSMSVLQTL